MAERYPTVALALRATRPVNLFISGPIQSRKPSRKPLVIRSLTSYLVSNNVPPSRYSRRPALSQPPDGFKVNPQGCGVGSHDKTP